MRKSVVVKDQECFQTEEAHGSFTETYPKCVCEVLGDGKVGSRSDEIVKLRMLYPSSTNVCIMLDVIL